MEIGMNIGMNIGMAIKATGLGVTVVVGFGWCPHSLAAPSFTKRPDSSLQLLFSSSRYW
jgi:hypothetical protein